MKNSALRKGAWDGEEDLLLRKCIDTYGEGNWHQVPRRAGLNRCRKSCRLRWLNYLNPNINREEFKEDEIDLIFKLHKLLGNRWSVISGRLPGRTANDIKNFWNSHLSKTLDGKLPNDVRSKPKKFVARTFRSRSVPLCGLQIPENLETESDGVAVSNLSKKQATQCPNDLTSKPKMVEVIRPRPRVFKPRSVPLETLQTEDQEQEQEQQEIVGQHGLLRPNEEQTMWWKDLVFYDEDMTQSSLVAMKEGLSSNPAMETKVAMDSEN